MVFDATVYLKTIDFSLNEHEYWYEQSGVLTLFQEYS